MASQQERKHIYMVWVAMVFLATVIATFFRHSSKELNHFLPFALTLHVSIHAALVKACAVSKAWLEA
jgi:hypothetical protein